MNNKIFKITKDNKIIKCKHIPSGIFSTSKINKRTAFERLMNNKKLRSWLKLEIMRKKGSALNVEKEVNKIIKKYEKR